MLPNLKPKTYRECQAIIGKTVNITLKVSERPLKFEIIDRCDVISASRRWMTLRTPSGEERRIESFRATLITEIRYGP